MEYSSTGIKERERVTLKERGIKDHMNLLEQNNE